MTPSPESLLPEPAPGAPEPPHSVHGFWQRYGALILMAFTGLQGAGLYFFDHRYATKDEVEQKTVANRTLIYDRTKETNSHVAGLETQMVGIKATLDERSKRDDANSAEIKQQLHDIEVFLRSPRSR